LLHDLFCFLYHVVCVLLLFLKTLVLEASFNNEVLALKRISSSKIEEGEQFWKVSFKNHKKAPGTYWIPSTALTSSTLDYARKLKFNTEGTKKLRKGASSSKPMHVDYNGEKRALRKVWPVDIKLGREAIYGFKYVNYCKYGKEGYAWKCCMDSQALEHAGELEPRHEFLDAMNDNCATSMYFVSFPSKSFFSVVIFV
jgi:hypothetical protein